MGDTPDPRMPDDTPSAIRCPMCHSTNVECDPKPHMHSCLDCGYDGTTQESTLGVRLRSQAEMSARPGQLDALNRIATEADRLIAENVKLQAIVDEWRAFCAALDEGEDDTSQTDTLFEGTLIELYELLPAPSRQWDTRVRVIAAPEDR